MNIWTTIVVGLLILIVLMHVAARLWPKQAGCRYLRHDLSKRGIRGTQIPAGCIRAFADEAHEYARLVCTPASRSRGADGRMHHFEFERMLRVHSFVIHAFLTGETPADEALMRELIRSEMLRAGVEPFGDRAQCQKIEAEVRAGSCWARYRAVLCRYELPMPISTPGTAIGEAGS